ncbi:MAG TPA: metalloregulator ArsR/SmtB family transcription factor [Candidatus Dormibacteraeota bacterium]
MRNPELSLRKEGSEAALRKPAAAAEAASAGLRPDEVRRAAGAVASRETYGALADLFEALSDPTRASIVHLLLDHELCTADVALVLGLKPPAASQHLRLLRVRRLVRTRRDGRLVLYHLDDAHVAQIVALGLAHVLTG